MRRNHPTRMLLASIASMLALAQGASHAAPPAGRLLASQCAQCHGTNGNGPGFDELAGRRYNDLYSDLIEMKYRNVEGIMDRQAHGYTDEQLGLISKYLSTQPGAGDN